jgi:hypothetical protein
MSLRNLLMAATELRVARPSKRNPQLSDGSPATGGATDAQQPPASSHEIRIPGATAGATGAQQGSRTGRNSAPESGKLRVAFARGAQPATPAVIDLIEAAMRACDHFGDGNEAREQMRADCEATPPHLRSDLLDHFRQTYPKELK